MNSNINENSIQIFENREFGKVRVVEINGEPWFVVGDVCEYFGVTNRSRVMQSVDDEDKGGTQMSTPGGVQNMAIVNESGLYSMLFYIQPTKARGISEDQINERQQKILNFKRWVTHEVLPSIRKHEMYITPQKTEEILNNPDVLISALTALKEEREKRKALESENKKLLPKATYCDMVLQTKNAVPISQIAKDYGMSAIKLNKLLHDLKVQYKVGGCWLLTQGYADKGYTKSLTHVISEDRSVIHTYWTQTGRLFLYELLKDKCGILPIMEKDAA